MTGDADKANLTAQAAARFSVRTFGSFQEAAPFADEWDALALQEASDVYATFEWCRTWWQFYGKGRHLELALVRRDERLVGVLPFFSETLWLGGLPARLMRLVGCDHSVTTANVVIEGGLEQEVIGAWARAGRDDWDAILLSPLPGYAARVAETGEAFAAAFRDCSVEVCQDIGPQIILDVPDRYEDYLEGLPTKVRVKGRQLAKRHSVSAQALASRADVEAAFGRFLPLHQSLWENKGHLGHFGDWPRALEFHGELIRRLAEHGRVLFLELEVDGAVAASQYCFAFGRRIHIFSAGRDDREELRNFGVGALIFADAVRYAIETGVTQLDTMRGYYDYKLRWGGRVVALKRILVLRRSLVSRAAMGVLSFSSKLLNLLYYRLWFLKVAPRLGVTTGCLWPLWIRTRL